MVKLKFFVVFILIILLFIPAISAGEREERNFFAKMWDFVKSLFLPEKEQIKEKQSGEGTEKNITTEQAKEKDIVSKETSEKIDDTE